MWRGWCTPTQFGGFQASQIRGCDAAVAFIICSPSCSSSSIPFAPFPAEATRFHDLLLSSPQVIFSPCLMCLPLPLAHYRQMFLERRSVSLGFD